MENKNMPAFPSAKNEGLTKLEYIASMNLQALLYSDRTKAWQREQVVQEAIHNAELLLKSLSTNSK